ncbi:MAG: serine protease [Bacillota bacterium]|nr:serine protease [Bacillota bacterium]
MKNYKKMFLICVFSMILVLLGACSDTKSRNVEELTSKNIQDPSVPENSIFRPHIELLNNNLDAGTAFGVELEGRKEPYVITAIHLFGPNGGLDKDIPSVELAKNIKKVSITDVFSSKECGTLDKILTIPEAKPVPEIDKDIAVFIGTSDLKINKFKINAGLPKEGDNVWLAASVYGGAPENQKLHKATITSVGEKGLYFKYENSNLKLQATSGAPILNSDGQVIGINISMISKNGDLIGVANPSCSFIKLIKNALNR